MISKEIIKECLEILDLSYTELENGMIAVSFSDEDAFAYQIVTLIGVKDDRIVTFSSQALDYHPEGDLLVMANRHNSRCHTPSCYIDSEGDVVMDRCFVIESEVSPHYILENVVKPSIYQPLDAFIFFEMSDEELDARYNRKTDE